MSRYPTKRELRDVIAHDIRTGYVTGTPDNPGRYNLDGVLRDLGVMGDRTYGYTFRDPGAVGPRFETALAGNVKRLHRKATP